MGNHLALELRRLAANIRDDAERAEGMGRGTIGIWALMSYAERLEKLVRELEEGEWPRK